MKKLLLITGLMMATLTAQADDDNLIRVQSNHSVAETGDRLEAALDRKGMAIFARINHAGGAKKVGLELLPTEQVIFGNPKIGTPLMQCQRTVAIDLPQKMMIWEDESGEVWLAYNNPEYLKGRHAVSGCDEVFKKLADALNSFATAATAP